MARINHVAKARKDQGKCLRCGKEITAGDSYYWVELKTGPRSSLRKTFCDTHRPRPSDTTTSDKLSTLYSVQEALEDEVAGATTKEDVAAALRTAAESAREVAEEYRDSRSNMPESLQDGATGQEMEEKADSIDSWADSLESAADEAESVEADEPEEKEDGDSEEDSEEDADDSEDDKAESELQQAKDIAESAAGELEV